MNTSSAAFGVSIYLFSLGMFPSPVFATPITTTGCEGGPLDNDCSLSELIAGGSIKVRDKIFQNWTLIKNEGRVTGSAPKPAAPPAPDLDKILVTPIDEPNNPGLKFTDNSPIEEGWSFFGSPGRNFVIETEFEFDVVVVDGRPLIKDNSLELQSFATGGPGGGLIQIDEMLFSAQDNFITDKTVFHSVEPGIPDRLFDSKTFQPTNFVRPLLEVFLATDEAGGFFDLNMFEVRFSQVPEPSMFAISSLGLLSVGIFGWRRKRRAASQHFISDCIETRGDKPGYSQ